MARDIVAPDRREPVTLGRSGLRVARLGLGASFAAPTAAYEEAFARGVNYFYWGTLRQPFMAAAIRHLAPRYRTQLVVVLQSYARLGVLVESCCRCGLLPSRSPHCLATAIPLDSTCDTTNSISTTSLSQGYGLCEAKMPAEKCA
jgi:hypothetical protein